MEYRYLKIGRWDVDFIFATDEYDKEEILYRLCDMGASYEIMDRSYDLMASDKYNTGFTFTNTVEHIALVVIGPSSSGQEFVDTLVHEIHHVAVAIASELGVDLEGETPAYIAGDSARALISLVCELGCSGHCRK